MATPFVDADAFTVTGETAALVVDLLTPVLGSSELTAGHRAYYRALLDVAEATPARPAPPLQYVAICSHTGLVFAALYPPTRKRARTVGGVAEELIKTAMGMERNPRKPRPGMAEVAITALHRCRDEGETRIPIIRTRTWAAMKAAMREPKPQRASRPVEARLVVDARETRGGVVDALRRLGLELEQEQLVAGDYCYRDGPLTWIAERKRADAELSLAIRDGSLTEQLVRMANTAAAEGIDRCYLIVEGDLYDRRVALQNDSLFGFLASMSAAFDVALWPSRGAEDTAQILAALARNAAKQEHRLRLRGPKPEAVPQLRARFLLEGLPGVGPELAERLLAHFGTAGAVFAASEAQLCQVEGVGKGRARGIRAALDAQG